MSSSDAFDPFGMTTSMSTASFDFVNFDVEDHHHDDSFGGGSSSSGQHQGSFGGSAGHQSSSMGSAGIQYHHQSEEHERSPSSRSRSRRNSNNSNHHNRSASTSPSSRRSTSRRRHRSRSQSRSPTTSSTSGRASLSSSNKTKTKTTTRKGKRPNNTKTGATSNSNSKSKPASSSSSDKKKLSNNSSSHRRSSRTSTSKHSSSSTSSGRKSSRDREDEKVPQTPSRGNKSSNHKLFSSLASPTTASSESSGSAGSFAGTTTPAAAASTMKKNKFNNSSSNANNAINNNNHTVTSSYYFSKMATHALSVWEMRQRFLQEFPNDSLPSDDVLKILYSPEKMEQIKRMERFQKEHPGEHVVPSDDVLKRLYDAPTPSSSTSTSSSSRAAASTTGTTTAAVPLSRPSNNNNNNMMMMVRQDSGLTFATEREWEQWKSSQQQTNGFSDDFGIMEDDDEFGRMIIPMSMMNGMEGIVEGGEESDHNNNSNDQAPPQWGNNNNNGSSLHSSSVGWIPVTNVVRKTTTTTTTTGKNNPSLDILEIGSSNDKTKASKRSSSQSLGSYHEKKTVMSDTNSKSLSQSVHGRKSIMMMDFVDFRKPAYQETKTLSAVVVQSPKFDPFDEEEEEEDLLVDDHGSPSKPSSQIDLLEVASEHLPSSKSADTTLDLVDQLATRLGFGDDIFPTMGHASFASTDSSSGNKPRKSKKSGTAKKDKAKTSKKKDDRSNRNSRTSDSGDNSKRGARTVSRNISRNHSDSLVKTSNQGKKTKAKTSVSRTKSDGGFDFETPPSFGFGGPNAFHEQAIDPAFADDDNNNKSANIKEDANNNNESSHEQDFFDVTKSPWGGHDTNAQSKFLTHSKNEKRPPKTNGIDSSEDRDFFPSSLPLGGNTNARAAAPSNSRRRSTTTNNHAMAGWMQEMPGFIAPLRQQPQEGSDDESGFDLALPGGGGDISPLTAYTRKPVRPMIRGRR